MHISILWGGVLDQVFGALPLLPFHCLPQSIRGEFLLSFSRDKRQHINMRVHSIFQEALPIPLLILAVVAAAYTVIP